jgi:hypothetical protein
MISRFGGRIKLGSARLQACPTGWGQRNSGVAAK